MLPSTFLVTNVNDTGAGSLRAAINSVNKDTGTQMDEIDFKLTGQGPWTINLKSELPLLKHSAYLNGSSQSGYKGSPLITLNGATIVGGGDGIVFNEANAASPFTGEVVGLTLTGFGDGIKVLDSGSKTAGTITLNNNTINLTSGGDGISVYSGTVSQTVSMSNNQVTVSNGGDGIALFTAGAANVFTLTSNTVSTTAGGDGIAVLGNGTSNTLTVTSNTVTAQSGGNALYLAPGSSATVSATISSNSLSTNNQGIGLYIGAGSKYQVSVQSNTFNNDQMGVKVYGDGTSAGTIDLGGGALGSTGGNDFRSFKKATGNSYAIGLFHVASTYTMYAQNNLFSVPATSVIADGSHDSAAHGSGTILV
jgi:hypothetical protein